MSVIVLDTSRAGYAGEDKPHVIIPRAQYSTLYSALSENHPLSEGSHSECPTIITDTPLTNEREVMTQVMFENLNVPSLYIAASPVLELYARGQTTGTVLRCGRTSNMVASIYEGYILKHGIHTGGLTGDDLDTHFATTLNISLPAAKDLKENFCFVAYDLPDFDMIYELPDGEVVTFPGETFQCPLEYPLAWSRMVYDTVMKSHIDVRKDLMANVVLAGKMSCIPGLNASLRKELESCVPASLAQVNVYNRMEHGVWRGGSILGSLSVFQQMIVSKAEYEEVGVNVVRKFT